MVKKNRLKAEKWLAKDKKDFDKAVASPKAKLKNKRFPKYVLDYLWDEAQKSDIPIPPMPQETIEKLKRLVKENSK